MSTEPSPRTGHARVVAAVVIASLGALLIGLAMPLPFSSRASVDESATGEAQGGGDLGSASETNFGGAPPAIDSSEQEKVDGDGIVHTTVAPRRQRGSTGYQPLAPPNEAPEVVFARRAAVAARFTKRPLYPASVAAYIHPIGDCPLHRDMARYDFEAAHRAYTISTTGKASSRYANLTTMGHYYESHLDAMLRRRNGYDINGTAALLETLAARQRRIRIPARSANGRAIVSPPIADTVVVNKTRVWESVLPDAREDFETEHESCHFVMARMLAIFASVMERLGIYTWFVSHGTLLGAIRHGGFIPWDVDVDIVMPRSAMTHLRKVWRSEFPRDMFLQTEKTEPSFHMWVGKERAMRVKDRYSTFLGVSFAAQKKGKRFRAKPWHLGVHLDIIPLERKGRGGSTLKILHSYFNRSTIFPLSAVCFENIIVPAPNNVTEFLTSLYGPAYMKVPPNATFLGAATNPCLAAAGSRGSQWSLSWRQDGKATGNATIGRSDGGPPSGSARQYPRDDPFGSLIDDYRYPYA